MTKRRRHLCAALVLAALAASCFGLLAWAIVEGAVVGRFPGDPPVRSDTAGHSYHRPNTVSTREHEPGRYWLVVGLLGFFGTVFAAVAALEKRSYRLESEAWELSHARARRDPDAASLRQAHDRNRVRQDAAALDRMVRAAVDRVVRSFNSRSNVTGVGLLERPDPSVPGEIVLYLVFSEPSDLDKVEMSEAGLEAAVRQALRGQGLSSELLDRVSVRRASAEVIRSSFGVEVLKKIHET